MSDYNKLNIAFSNHGLNIAHAARTLPFGKFKRLNNVYSTIEGQLTRRAGNTDLTAAAISGTPNIVALHRVDDNIRGYSAYLALDANGVLWGSADAASSPYDATTTAPFYWIQIQTGFAGSPETSFISTRSGLASQVWTYVSDVTQTRKVNIDASGEFVVDVIGLAGPPGTGDTWDFLVDAEADADGDVGFPSSLLILDQGDYSYFYTYYDSSTGAESAPSAIETVTLATTDRVVVIQFADDAAMPAGADSVRLYRKLQDETAYRGIAELAYDGTDPSGNGFFYPYYTHLNQAAVYSAIPSGLTHDTLYADAIRETSLGVRSPQIPDITVVSSDTRPFVTIDTTGAANPAQSLPYLFGPHYGFLFACGDPVNPGYLYWTNKYNPDRQDYANNVEVTPSGDPLRGGVLYNNVAYVFSRSGMYRLTPILDSAQFVPSRTAVQRGLHSPNALVVGNFIYFMASDGIYATNGGAEISLTDAEMAPLFRGQTAGSHIPVDLTNTTHFLTLYNSELYFHYIGTDANQYCLVFDTEKGRWRTESYAALAPCAINDHILNSMIVGGPGVVYSRSGATDDGTQISETIQTPVMTMGAPLIHKDWGGVVFDADTFNQGAWTVNFYTDRGNTLAQSSTIPSAATRGRTFISLGDLFSEDLMIEFTRAASGNAGVLFAMEILYRPEVTQLDRWQVTGITHGIPGWQIVRGAYITYRSDGTLTLTQTVDGTDHTYTLASTSGAKSKIFIPFDSTKGKIFDYELTLGTATYFRLYTDQCEVHAKPWISSSGWAVAKPFSGGDASGDAFSPDPNRQTIISPVLGPGGAAEIGPITDVIGTTEQFNI